jgi:hypothetical protein
MRRSDRTRWLLITGGTAGSNEDCRIIRVTKRALVPGETAARARRAGRECTGY